MCLVRIREHERLRWRGGGIVGSWLWYAIHRHLHTLSAIVTDVGDVEARPAGAGADGEGFPISNRCAGHADLTFHLTRCAERNDYRVVRIVHRPQQIGRAAAQRQSARFRQLAEQLQRSRSSLRQIARQLVSTGRPRRLGARTATYRRVPRDEAEDDKEGGEVRLPSQHPQPSFFGRIHGSVNCNIETALVPLPATSVLAGKPGRHHLSGELFYEMSLVRTADARARDNRWRNPARAATGRRRGQLRRLSRLPRGSQHHLYDGKRCRAEARLLWPGSPVRS